ncbi:hypothetical protein VQL36_13300 [Chengkuizengella sp. SCS-71B]|uniref:hypothetical protein n=1 Tax=Chengkuizengella sp. SCS-71B TaxID=3115290 RepID=UPI0032C2192B
MGAFDRTICDCCVCPMQCVLKQLEGLDVGFATLVSSSTVGSAPLLVKVEDFIAFTTEGMYAICEVNAVAVASENFPPINLKPLHKDKKGECSCCEDPTTNLLKKLIGQTVSIEALVDPSVFIAPLPGVIFAVGEGIVLFDTTLVNPMTGELVPVRSAVSTCKITRVITS